MDMIGAAIGMVCRPGLDAYFCFHHVLCV